MTTFGHIGIGAASATMTADFKRGTLFNLPTAGTLSKLSAYLGGGASSQLVKALVYSDTALTPNAKKATSTQITIGVSQAPGWVDFPLAVALDAGDYWLALLSGSTSGMARYYYDYRSLAQRVNADSYSGSGSSFWGSGTTYDDRKMSIYATYVALDRIRPSVRVTLPVASAILSGAASTLAVVGTDEGPPGPLTVQFYADAIPIGTPNVSPTTWNTTLVPDGSYAITVVVGDAAGNTRRSEPVYATVANRTTGGAVAKGAVAAVTRL